MWGLEGGPPAWKPRRSQKVCSRTGQARYEEAALRSQSQGVVEDRRGWNLGRKSKNTSFRCAASVVSAAKRNAFDSLGGGGVIWLEHWESGNVFLDEPITLA